MTNEIEKWKFMCEWWSPQIKKEKRKIVGKAAWEDCVNRETLGKKNKETREKVKNREVRMEGKGENRNK